MVAFLARNGIEMTATSVEAVLIVLALAAGEVTEAALADWIEAHSHAS
jgi:death-on-curing protein